jgi:16S rRNA (guanine(527)-N(7))-methyltransferase RsmG
VNKEPGEPNNEVLFAAALAEALKEVGVSTLSAVQQTQLARHYAMLVTWNRRINLTRIIQPQAAARLHYAESLFGSIYLGDARTILDIGSGAGFPAIPLAIAHPETQVTALEANQRKAVFLSEAGDALGLSNLRVVSARVESFDLTPFDVFTSRALDRAAGILPAIIERMALSQRFLLYGATELINNLRVRFEGKRRIETHLIPGSQDRLVAVISI